MNPSTPQPDFCLLLDQQQPATVLSLLGDGELAPQLGTFKAEALVMLDRVQEANPLCQRRRQHCPDPRGARRCAMNDF